MTFATHIELGKAMKREFTTEEQEWVDTLLKQASAYMRGVIGAHVAPPKTATFTAWPSGGRVTMPQTYVTAIGPVTRDGVAVPFERFEDSAVLSDYITGPVDVTFAYGCTTVPDDLVGIACGIVSGQLTLVENELGLQVGGLSSIALDDFKIAFADGGAHTGLALPEPQKEYLRNAYGTTGWVVGTR